MDVIPWVDAGVIVVLFTAIIKLILFPLSKKAVNTQIQMKAVEPELAEIKEKYKNDKQELARKTMDLYKEKGIRPFTSVLLVFIQLPIIFALYRVFWHSGLPTVNTDILYSFVHVPESINMMFLGLINISLKSKILAVLVGLSAYLQARIVTPKPVPKKDTNPNDNSFKHDFARSMSIQMRYVFPIIAVFISYGISAAISLYWITSNIFTIGQELFLKRKLKR